ncbi:hypothetical protein ACFE04_002844 [Oxalis oulophora]
MLWMIMLLGGSTIIHLFFIVYLADKLLYLIRILLEFAVSNCDNFQVKKEDIEKIIDWEKSAPKQVEIPFKPSRVLLHNFTGVPSVVDLVVMRDPMNNLGSDSSKINPLMVHFVGKGNFDQFLLKKESFLLEPIICSDDERIKLEKEVEIFAAHDKPCDIDDDVVKKTSLYDAIKSSYLWSDHVQKKNLVKLNLRIVKTTKGFLGRPCKFAQRETKQCVALAILRGLMNLKRQPWPQGSESARNLSIHGCRVQRKVQMYLFETLSGQGSRTSL